VDLWLDTSLENSRKVVTEINEFFNANNFRFPLDARLKLLLLFFVLVLTLSSKSLIFPLTIIFLCLLSLSFMKINLKKVIVRISEPLFIVFVILLIKSIFSQGEILFEFLIIKIYKGGFLEGLEISLRVLACALSVSIISLSTPFNEIISSLSWFKVPKTLIEIMIFTYRYLFMLLDEALVIYCSQKQKLGYSSFKNSVRSFGYLVGALLIKTFEHCESIVQAMKQRGYEGYVPIRKEKSFKKIEVIGSLIFLIIIGMVWWL